MIVLTAFVAIVSTVGVIVLTVRNGFLQRNLTSCQNTREAERNLARQLRSGLYTEIEQLKAGIKDQDQTILTHLATIAKLKRKTYAMPSKFSRERRLKR